MAFAVRSCGSRPAAAPAAFAAAAVLSALLAGCGDEAGGGISTPEPLPAPSPPIPELSDANVSWTYHIPDPWGILDYSLVPGLDGSVYQQTPSGLLIALSSDGSVRWEVNVSCCGPHFGQGSVPSLSPDGEQIYVVASSGDGREDWREVWALKVADGSHVWRFSPAVANASEMTFSLSSHTPKIGQDGTIYVLLSQAGVMALSAEDGSQVWSEPLQLSGNVEHFRAAMAPSTPSNNREELLVVSACGDMDLLLAYAVGGAAPELRWNISVAGDGLLMEGCPVASPVIGEDGTVYLATTDHSISAWAQPVAGQPGGGSARWIKTLQEGGKIWAEPSVPPGLDTVFFGSEDTYVYAVSASTGEERWTYKTGGYVTASPAVSADGLTVHVGSYDGCLYALGASDGSVRWRHREVFVFAAAAAMSGDLVLAGSGNGTIFAFAPSDPLANTTASAAVLA